MPIDQVSSGTARPETTMSPAALTAKFRAPACRKSSAARSTDQPFTRPDGLSSPETALGRVDCRARTGPSSVDPEASIPPTGDEEYLGVAHIELTGPGSLGAGHGYAARLSQTCTDRTLRFGGRSLLLNSKSDLTAGSLSLLSRRRPPVARAPVQTAASTGLDERVVILIVALAVVACAGLIASFHGLVRTVSSDPGRVATIIALTLALQMFSVQVYGRGSVGVSGIGFLTSAILFDVGTTMAIAVLAAIVQWIRTRSPLYKAVFDAANFSVSGAAAALVFQLVNGGWRLPAAILAGALFAALNNGVLCLVMSLTERTSWKTIWFERFHWARFHFALFGPVALAATIAYKQIGTAGLVAFTLPPALMILSVRQYIARTTAAVEEIREANLNLRRAHKDTIAALSRSMEAKDLYTGGHTERVAAVAVGLARKLGFKDDELEAIEIGALLHDIGKIGIPGHVLRKPGKLNEEEWELIKTHPVISDYILSELDLHPFVRQCARSSHERIDGTGYPDGLSGDEIPLPARIVLVADALDALTTTRPYRPARPMLGALAEIRAHTGTQFCPRVVDALEDLWRTEPAVFSAEAAAPAIPQLMITQLQWPDAATDAA
jgi:HD domain